LTRDRSYIERLGLGFSDLANSTSGYRHAFRGNVRELRTIVERVCIESGGRPIEIVHLHFLTSGES